MAIKPINHYALTTPASIHDEEAITALELAGRTAAKVNEAVGAFNQLHLDVQRHHTDHVNSVDQRINQQDVKIEYRLSLQDNAIPIAVSNTVNQHINDGTFDEQIEHHIGNLEDRVDNLLASVPEGPTTMDAEIIDMRTDADGTIHPNAGEALRKQTSNIPPTRINRGEYGEVTPVVGTITTGSYLTASEFGELPIAREQELNAYIKVECDPDNVYYVQGSNINALASPKTFFCFLDSFNRCCIPSSTIKKYVREISNNPYTYVITPPVHARSFTFTFAVKDQENVITGTYDSGYSVEWLRLMRSNFPDKSVPVNALDFDNYGVVENCALSFEDGYYFKALTYPPVKVAFNGQSIMRASVKPGDTYIIYPASSSNLYSDDNESLKYNFAFFETGTEFESAIARTDFDNYVTINEDNTLTVVIPENCQRLVSCCMTDQKANVYIHHNKTIATFPDLRLTEENFTPRSIPASALKDAPDSSYGAPAYWSADVVEKPFDFEGKTLLAFGDSITAGVLSPNLVSAPDKSYIKLFADKFGMTLNNAAVSGSTFTRLAGDSHGCIIDAVVNSTTTEPDFIMIAGGTNDYNQGRQIGAFGDTQQTTVYGAVDYICRTIAEKWPNATVIFITPIPVTKYFAKAIAPLDDYRHAIFDVVTSYGYSVVNGATIGLPDSPTTYANEFFATEDGCHPTEKGSRAYYKGLLTKLV